MSKRRRTQPFVQTRQARRPIDKDLIGVVITNAGTTQRTTTLKTATFPCTVTGLRWSLSFLNLTTTDSVQGIWVIVLVQDGEAINTISISDAATILSPEQNILAFGAIGMMDADTGQGPTGLLVEGSTKTMRKLKAGDVLQFACIMTAGSTNRIRGAIQFFCKS